MIIKAMLTYAFEGRKIVYTLSPQEMTLPPMTKASFQLDRVTELDLRDNLPKTGLVDIEVRFSCLSCDFKTTDLSEMGKHAKSHQVQAAS